MRTAGHYPYIRKDRTISRPAFNSDPKLRERSGQSSLIENPMNSGQNSYDSF
jgi:hypothetical protein